MQEIASSGFALLAMTRYTSSCGGLLRHFMPRNDMVARKGGGEGLRIGTAVGAHARIPP